MEICRINCTAKLHGMWTGVLSRVFVKIFPDLTQKILIVIMIAIELLIRIDQTLLEKFLADFDEKKFSRPYS